jgi:hypothetical protein
MPQTHLGNVWKCKRLEFVIDTPRVLAVSSRLNSNVRELRRLNVDFSKNNMRKAIKLYELDAVWTSIIVLRIGDNRSERRPKNRSCTESGLPCVICTATVRWKGKRYGSRQQFMVVNEKI